MTPASQELLMAKPVVSRGHTGEPVKRIAENTGRFNNQSVDATMWAREFVRLHGGDEGLMLTWFANAIMAGYDEAMRRADRNERQE